MAINDDIVIHPARLRKERPIPEAGLLLVNPSEARYGLEVAQNAGAELRSLYNSNLCVHESGGSFVAGPAIGAPMAVMTLEKLIALGARKILLFGWCGSMKASLNIGDLLLPSRAMSGEGTSLYYTFEDKPPEPSQFILEKMKFFLKSHDISWKDGCVWSTDAPYREKRSYLKKLQEENDVSAVDMEYAALCNAASFRNIDFAALLLVSDEVWGKSWNPGFSNREFKVKSRKLIDMLIKGFPLRD